MSSDSAEAFGTRLRKLRKQRDLTQQQLAERAFLSTKYVSQIEAARHPHVLRPSTKRALAEALGVEVEDLVPANGINQATTDSAAHVPNDENGWTMPSAPLRAAARSLSKVQRPRFLPPRVPGFVGRDGELSRLSEILREGRSEPLAALVVGMAGVGKSALAAEAVFQVASDSRAFRGGIACVRCDDRNGLTGLVWIYDQLLQAWGAVVADERLRREVGLEAEVALREHALRRCLRHRCGGMRQSQALVLLDNAEHDLPLCRIMETLLPLGVVVLVTARHESSSPRLRVLHVGVLPPQPAIQLFAARLVAKGGVWTAVRDEGPTAAIVRAVGRLPLAIELAAARVALGRRSIVQTASELSAGDRLGWLRDPLDHTQSILHEFRKTLALLTTSQRVRFASLGLLEGADWPSSVMESFLGAVQPDDLTTTGIGVDLDALIALSLVNVVLSRPDASSRIESTKNAVPRVRLHPLLRDLAREEWNKLSPEGRRRCISALLSAVAGFVRDNRHHFTALAREEALITGALRRAATDHIQLRVICAAVDDLESYFNTGSHWRVGWDLLHLQLDAVRAAGDQLGEGRALHYLGTMAMNLGRLHDAEHLFEQALVIARDVGDRAGEAQTLNNRGSLANKRGDPIQAEKYYKQSLKVRSKTGDRLGEGRVLNNLGLLAAESSRLDDASFYYGLALPIRREVGDRAGEADTILNLGLLAWKRGNLDEATRILEEALEISRGVCIRVNEGRALNNLGCIAFTQGHGEEALRYFDAALDVARDIGDRYSEALTINNIGETGRMLGLREDALRFCEQALALATELGYRSIQASALKNLSDLANDVASVEDAERLYGQAAAMYADMGNVEASGDIRSKIALLQDIKSVDGTSESRAVPGPTARAARSTTPQRADLDSQTSESMDDGSHAFLNDVTAEEEPPL